jgi:natural product biosynthesis luciferase-like monooxygenase protein
LTFQTIIDLLRSRAESDAERVVYGFFDSESGVRETLTFGELHRKAVAVAAKLQSESAAGERALVIFSSGLECIVAFWGCLYSGIIAVPVPPFRLKGRDPRIRSIAEDAGVTLILGTDNRQLSSFVREFDKRLRVVEPEQVQVEPGESWTPPALTRDSIALLQYTSGSTGVPKGVVVSHGNLLGNAACMQEAFGLTAEERSVLWLPLFHDMGLMGGVIQSVYSGYRTVFLAPSTFIHRPLHWLELVTSEKATISGGPNFGYDLCARLVSESERLNLDLSAWRIAFNGSETVRCETLQRFEAAFRQYGFRPDAFRPCYGLAEATLLVSAVRSKVPPVLTINTKALEQGEIETAGGEEGGVKKLVSVGQTSLGQSIAIVEPETGALCVGNRIGEVWVSGPGVAQGYWNRNDETTGVFHAHIQGGNADTYLRTGDLGTVQNGELYITGRLKDLIIIRGRNYYPNDIESTCETGHSALRPGHSAAFSVEVNGEERLVVVQEVTRAGLKADHSEAIRRIRLNIFAEHELNPHAVVLIRTGTLPKTTSGKIQRRECREAYLSGRLNVVAANELKEVDLSPGEALENLAAKFTRLLANLVGCSETELDEQRTPVALGLDSVKALEVKMAVEQLAGREIPVSRLLGDLPLAELRKWVEEAANPRVSPLEPAQKLSAREFPLSAGQRALWFVQHLDPNNASLNIARLLRIQGPLNSTILRSAFAILVERHPCLRMRVTLRNGEPWQTVEEEFGPDWQEHDARGWGEQALIAHAEKEARKPFDLKQGPILRLRLYPLSESDACLLVCIHHIAADLWSLNVMIRELKHTYEALNANGQPELPERGEPYSTYVEWQSSMLSGSKGQELLQYWQHRLADLPVPLDLAIGRRGTATATSRTHRFPVLIQLVSKIKELARRNHTTLHTVLIGAFQVLLYRYSGKNDFLLGVLSAGRSHAAWNYAVGYFVNPVVTRPKPAGHLTFIEFLRSTKDELLRAMDHAEYPFPLLAERMPHRRTGRGVSPVQVMCNMQSSSAGGIDIGGFASGCAGSSFTIGDLRFDSIDTDFDGAQFELVLSCIEVSGAIQAAFQYDTGCFEEEGIAGLAADYITLLESIFADPQNSLDCLDILDRRRMRAAMLDCADAGCMDVPETSIHRSIERQAVLNSTAVAVVCESEQLSYGELNARANRLAHYLADRGLGPEDRAGIFLERSCDLVVAILAVLKTGAAYVPLDSGYPPERIHLTLQSSRPHLVVTSESLRRRLPDGIGISTVSLDVETKSIAERSGEDMTGKTDPRNLAYLMHTSGSSGRPKGVMISHRNVLNFFRGMDGKIGIGPLDTLLAVTSVGFDISVLELLWTLSRGARVVIGRDPIALSGRRQDAPKKSLQKLRFSLFYFAATDAGAAAGSYRLLLEGAKLADRLGFEAVWTPERHFHSFGGLYPNPSVTSAVLAGVTTRIHLRAGSVVLPLHNPIRVAEEWALVDNLSQGRVGLAFASGWHADDFVFSPENYSRRREVMLEGIEQVRRLWRGGKAKEIGGAGREIEIATYPRPLQAELPVWLTSGGSPETFVAAGRIGANVLTHLLGQQLHDLSERIAAYRSSLRPSAADLPAGKVTLMLHTYLDESQDKVREKALAPFKRYLDSSIGLASTLIRSLNIDLDIEKMTGKDRDDLLTFAAERYLHSSGLMGTEKSCLETLETISDMEVNEIACLVDFGIDVESVMQSIQRIHGLWERISRPAAIAAPESLGEQAVRHRVTMMQCTPSFLRLAAGDSWMKKAMGSLRFLMVGGEPVPSSLVREAAQNGAGRIANMYGPTETTIWSTVLELDPKEESAFIGGPIANTQIYILGGDLTMMPPGTVGEICIGGEGLARGYFGDPCLTAEKFLPDPFGGKDGGRIYRTGDIGRLRSDGRIELLGRSDDQVKIRGHRIELGDIEATLNTAPGVQTAVAVKAGQGNGEDRLVAFLVPFGKDGIDVNTVQEFVRSRLPHYMVPSAYHTVSALPLSANGKVDRKALRVPETVQRALPPQLRPQTTLESQIAAIWRELLQVDAVSVDDSFFDVGGHSLLLVQAHHRVQELVAREFPLMAMLEHPTVRAIAGYLEGTKLRTTDSSVQRASKQKIAVRQQRERASALRNLD